MDDNLSTLIDFQYKTKYAAEGGKRGAGKNCHGQNGEDLVIKVPLGTVIKDAESGLVIADLSDHTPVTAGKGWPRRLRQRTFCHADPPDPQVCQAWCAR